MTSNLLPVQVPNGRYLSGMIANPANNGIYAAYIQFGQGSRGGTGIWVGRREGDVLVELGAVMAVEGYTPDFGLLQNMQWLDDSTLFWNQRMPDGTTYGIRLAKVTDAGWTLGPLTGSPQGQQSLTVTPQVTGTTAAFLFSTGNPGDPHPVQKLSVGFASEVPTITVTDYGFLTSAYDPYSGLIDRESAFFSDGGLLLAANGSICKRRLDGSMTTPVVIPKWEYAIPGDSRSFQTMENYCLGSSSWVNEPMPSGEYVVGIVDGDRYYWHTAIRFIDEANTEAVWVRWDVEAGTREIFSTGLLGGNWNYSSGTYWPGQTTRLDGTTLWSLWQSFQQTEDGSSGTVYQWVTIDTSTREATVLLVGDQEGDYARFEGIPAGTGAEISGLVSASYVGYFFYPAVLPEPEPASALLEVRRIFA